MSNSPNGCGPSWMPDVVKSLLFDWFFEASCNIHDNNYTVGGTEEDRAKADKGFYKAMKRDVKRLPYWKRIFAAPTAITYYGIVRAFGWMQFNYTDKSKKDNT